MNCKFCNKECKNHNSLRNHERLCKHNPNKQEHPRGYKGKIAWNKGLTKETDSRVKQMSETRNERISTGEIVFNKHPHTDEVKQILSQMKIELYASGWEPTCGRCKKYDYISPIAGTIKVDGTWELAVAKHLDKIGVTWKRNKKRFPYVKPDNTTSTYQPDFFVKEWDSYLEVKGYETELDRCKWSQFPENLIIWKREDIDKIRE